MNCHVRKVIPILVSLFFVMPGASWLHAQIANDLRAHIDHPFVIGDTTLPPGEYTFHVMQGVENSVMGKIDGKDQAGKAAAGGEPAAQDGRAGAADR